MDNKTLKGYINSLKTDFEKVFDDLIEYIEELEIKKCEQENEIDRLNDEISELEFNIKELAKPNFNGNDLPF